MWVRVLSAGGVAVLIGLAAMALVRSSGSSSGSADSVDSEIVALCDEARALSTELSGARNDQALITALSELQRLAPSTLSRDVGVIVDARRALAAVGNPDELAIDEAMAIADQITAAEGAPLERLNRALATECDVDVSVPAIGH